MITLLLFALCNNAILLIFYKWHILLETYQMNKKKWMPDWCELCFFWWLGLIEHISINLTGIISFYLFGSVIVHSLACCFLTLFIKKLYDNI